VLITKDKDFVPAESPRPQFQVVWIRTGNVPNRVLIGAPVVELR
jgi:predicted nuclease of predicted toxin-antitoxin system